MDTKHPATYSTAILSVVTTSLTVAAVAVVTLTLPVAAQTGAVRLSVEVPEDAEAGAALFRERSCARCHSYGGRGAGVAPDLANLNLEGSLLDLAGTFWNHAPLMRDKMQEMGVVRPELTKAEMSTLVAWLSAYRHYNRTVREPANPALGRNAFVTKRCAECHERRGDTPAPGPELSSFRGRAPVLFAEAMWNHSPEMASAMEARDLPWPTFDDREMTDLIAYLQVGLVLTAPNPIPVEPGDPKEGEVLFAAKGCIVCHTIAGQGGRGGPDLAESAVRVRTVAEIAGDMWNHSVGMRPEFDRRNQSHPLFLSGEMADLLAYLYFVSYSSVEGTPERGGELFVQKCSTCHTLGRNSVGPDLMSVPDLDDSIGIVTAMWNHATRMEAESELNAPWPQLALGDAADLAAFLITRRAAASAR